MSAVAATANPEALDLYGRPSISRRLYKFFGWGICISAVLTIAAPLIWVLYGVVSRALTRMALERTDPREQWHRRRAGQ